MQEIKALSVTDLTKTIKKMFDDNIFLANVIVEGEISNFKNNSGHLYFTLKDENAQLAAVMFRGSAQYLNFVPKDGTKVYAIGSIQVYEKTGRYQIYVTQLKERGIGDLYQKYEELKKKLEMKGYFDASRKKSFPEFPKNIALLTSSTGAVIEDLKSIILKRSQFSDLTLYPTRVQGVEAKDSIIRNIKKANENPDIDVIILARGGGSIEDLWPFNEEEVADAIYNSKKPVMSAVGHETDFTISDFVADMRAATPSDAALRVVLDNVNLLDELNSLTSRLKSAYISKLEYLDSTLKRFKLIDKERLFERKENSLVNICQRLENASPLHTLEKSELNLNKLTKDLNNSYSSILSHYSYKYSVLNEKICLLNPLTILDKGYSVTYKNNTIIKDAADAEEGDIIETKLSKGTLKSKVLERTLQNG